MADRDDLTPSRVVIKLSGEALTGDDNIGINPSVIDQLSQQLITLTTQGIEVAVVVGGGNLFRGEALSEAGLGRVTGDFMGMLATIMNALALRDACERMGANARVLSAIPIAGIADPYHYHKAVHHLTSGRIVIFSGGTGNPFVTTDSAASLRAAEINADMLLKATQVDGVYDKDPLKHSDAILYKRLSYQTALKNELGIMDLAAFCQCRDYNIPIKVFKLDEDDSIVNAINASDSGTLITHGDDLC